VYGSSAGFSIVTTSCTAAAAVQEVVTIENPALEPYTPDGYTAALQQAIAQLSPSTVVLPHTYQTRDFAPKLAARLDRSIVTDVTAVKRAGNDVAFVRPMFQGKLTADVVAEGPGPHFVTFQIGAFRADQAARGNAPASGDRCVYRWDTAAPALWSEAFQRPGDGCSPTGTSTSSPWTRSLREAAPASHFLTGSLRRRSLSAPPRSLADAVPYQWLSRAEIPRRPGHPPVAFEGEGHL